MNPNKVMPEYSLHRFEAALEAMKNKSPESADVAAYNYMLGLLVMVVNAMDGGLHYPGKWLREEETGHFLSCIESATRVIIMYREAVINDWAKCYGENKKGGQK